MKNDRQSQNGKISEDRSHKVLGKCTLVVLYLTQLGGERLNEKARFHSNLALLPVTFRNEGRKEEKKKGRKGGRRKGRKKGGRKGKK